MKTTLLEIQYFGCINWFSNFASSSPILLEQYEHYEKASFRNRCILCSSSGPLSLTVPIVGGRGNRLPIRDVRINYEQKWQVQHWKAIKSCYANTPFYEHYEESLSSIFEIKHTFLWDLNMEILEWLFRTLKLEPTMTLTTEYCKTYPESIHDIRGKWLPNNYSTSRNTYYSQPFANTSSFLHNLSILDILFCEGPNSKVNLRSIK